MSAPPTNLRPDLFLQALLGSEIDGPGGATYGTLLGYGRFGLVFRRGIITYLLPWSEAGRLWTAEEATEE